MSTLVAGKPRFKVHYAWIYVTERCNLRCEYCFFRHRQRRDISLEFVRKLFLLFERQQTAPVTLIFSGGEPFLAREKLFKILNEAHRRFPKTALHIQTNGSLIDEASIKQLRRLNVSLEFGIDGGCEQTLRHRHGLKPGSFKHLTDTIRACRKAGISCGCTMTIHPDEVQHMAEGLKFIQTLGISRVDVTPAAFMPWTPQNILLFKKNYLALARQAVVELFYVRDDMEWIKSGVMDLSLHPPGHLLGGDPFLCLPEIKRKEFSLWEDSSGEFKPEVLSYYQGAYARMYRKNELVSYRKHVAQSFDLVNAMMEEHYMNTAELNEILRFMARIHRSLRIKNTQHDKKN